MPFMLSKNEHHKVHVNNRHFALIFDRLYGRNTNRILRRCVNYHEIAFILEACHDSACGSHFPGHLIIQKIRH
jgi:hypothetical protein